MSEKNNEYVLEMNDISKTFPGVKALDHAHLNLKRGEVLALCGENGAGKSTLMKVLSGVYHPDKDSGDIIYNGSKVSFNTPIEAKNAGIVIVFQELSLVNDLSISENIFLGSLPMKGGRVDWKKLNNDTKEILDKIGCPAKPTDVISQLPIAQMQMVEIGRGLALGAKVLILDEPTSSLTEKEKLSLFDMIRKLKSEGVSIVYISHKMDEIMEITDRVLVMRDGQTSGEFVTKDVKLDDIIQSMIGRSLNNYYVKNTAKVGEDILKVDNLSVKGCFENISFSARAGEVLGFYGLVGAGRTEIMETIFGIRKADSGDVYIKGKKAKIHSSVDAVKAGIGFVTEDRKEQGLVLMHSCRNNMILAKLKEISKLGFVSKKESYNIYDEYSKKLELSSPGSESPVVNLSGGNQQKVVIAKWMSMHPDVLILDEPTRGIDVGAKYEIYKLIAELAEAGIAIIVISSEMPEIIGICNRVLAITQGHITNELTGDDITEEKLMNSIIIDNSKAV